MFTLSLRPLLTLGLVLAAATTTLLPAGNASAHCQVPCGIYGDKLKFEEIKQHVETIAKSMTSMQELAGKQDVQSMQQFARWTANKDLHADKIQHEAQYYFLAQRIKFPEEESKREVYHGKLQSLHEIIVYAMKCKQTVDPANGEKLLEAINTFEGQYFEKMEKAHLDHDHHDHKES